MEIKGVGLVFGPHEHHLDHIATLAILLKIPLVVTEPEIFNLAQIYYPELVVYHHDALTCPKFITKNFDVIFSSFPVDFIQELFFMEERLQGKKLLSVWAPHGNSDKGHFAPFMEALHKEHLALIYGEKMRAFLDEKGVLDKIGSVIETGNLRHQYYERHKRFYDKKAREKLSLTGKKTLLYAPTWQDLEESCSLFSAGPKLIEDLSPEHDLIIKLHPNTTSENLVELERLKGAFEGREGLHFLTHFPPIYPLLNLTDVYIGDMSSIGYDFLAFNRPMLFLNPKERSTEKWPLHSCGLPYEQKDEDQNHLSSARTALYEKTFGHSKDWTVLRQKILTKSAEIVENLYL